MDDYKKQSLNDKISGLDNESRKDLFNKFVESGGQVVEEKKKSSNVKFNRERQRELLKQQEIKKETLSKKYGTKSSIDLSEKKKTSSILHEKENPYEGVGKIGLYFSSVFSRIRTWAGGYFTPTFIKQFKDTAQNKFLDLNLIITTIIHSHSMTSEGLKKDLILKYPLYYELLLRLDKLYDDKIFIEFKNMINKNSIARIKIKDCEQYIKPLLKKLYILSAYKSDCIEAIGTAFGLMQKYEKLSRSSINDSLAKARNSINFLMGSFFDKLFLSYLNCINSNISLNNPIIPKLLNFREEDYVGYIVKKIKEELKKHQKDEDETESEEIETEEKKEEKKDSPLPVEVQNGMDLLEELTYTKQGISRDNPAYYFEENDKIFHTYIILEEFEKQFSFVLTSNKIKYVVDYQQGGRFDPKTEFNEIYIQLNNIHDSIREYQTLIREEYEIENQAGVPMMQKHSQLHNLSIRKSKLNMSIRVKLLDIIRKLDKLLTVINEKSERVIQNTEEQLSFDNSLEGKKKLHSKTPIECIRMTNEFTKAFLFKLEKGDLSGSGIGVN